MNYNIINELNKDLETEAYYLNETAIDIFNKTNNLVEWCDITDIISIFDNIDILNDLEYDLTTHLEQKLIKRIKEYYPLYPQYCNYLLVLLGAEDIKYDNQNMLDDLIAYDEYIDIEEYYTQYIQNKTIHINILNMHIDIEDIQYNAILTNNIAETINEQYKINKELINYINYSKFIKENQNIHHLYNEYYIINPSETMII